MNKSVFKSESGFTMQELLVVLNVSFLLVSFSLMVFLSMSKFVTAWQQRSHLRDTVNRIAQRIILDVQRSESVVALSDSLLTLKSLRGNEVQYRFIGNEILRNGITMTVLPKVSLSAKVTSPAESIQSRGSEWIRIEIVGMLKNMNYSAEGEAATAANGFSEFEATKTASL